MRRATFFKSSAPSSPEQAKPNRQSIRGRISAPIPFPDPLDGPVLTSTEISAAAPAPAPAPAQEVVLPESKLPMPTSPPPPTRASPPPPVVSAFSEDLEDSDAEEEAVDEVAGEDTTAEVEVGGEEEVGAKNSDEKAEEATEAGDAGDNVEPVVEPMEANAVEPANDHADHEAEEEEATAEAEPLPPLQSPKVRSPAAYTIGHRRIPTAELSPRPQQLQQPQLPLPEPPASPPSQSQARLQYQLPQDQSSPFRQAGQPPGPSPPPLSVGPSAISSARASGTASAANSAASPAFRHRTNPSSTLRYSGASGMSSGGAGTSAGNTVSGSPKRKKSTLRGAFSKLFSRRKKTDSQILPTIAADPTHDVHDMDDSHQVLQQQQYQQQQHQQQQQAPQHRSVRSDPTVLGRARDSEPKRSASLPITEYDRALRSHSIGPEELMAIESARNSFQADHGPVGNAGIVDASGRRRAATATNRAFFSPQTQGGRRRFNNKSETYANILSGSGWTGLSPRPASAQGRKSQNRLSGSDIVSGAAGGALGRNWAASGAGGPGSAGLGLGSGFNLFGGAGGAGRNGSGAATDPNEIGRAITSNGRDSLEVSNDLSSWRRSRSLSNLHSLSFDQNQSRGRNDEIRYWRESYDPAFLSPLSSSHDMGHEHDDEEDGLNVQRGNANAGPGIHGSRGVDGAAYHGGEDDLTGTISLLQSLPDSPIDSPIEQDDERQKGKQPKTPPQPFSFGNLSSLGGVSGPMKITQANSSMDTRIGGLETRMHRMERVVDQLCHTVSGYKEPSAAGPDQIPRSVPPFPDAFSGQPAIPPIPAIYQTQAATPFTASSSRYSNSRHSAHSGDSFESDLQHSHMSFGDGQTYIGSLHPPSSSATQAQSIMASAGGPSAALAPGSGNHSPALRPTSTSTVRGSTSLPALNAAIDNSTAELLAQLKSEREVRQTLETQVKKLNERVNALSTTMYAMLRDPAAARPKSSHHKPSSALGSAPSTNSLRGKSASAAASAAAAATQLKAESVLQTAKALGHGVSSFSADEEETESEGFQTPMEGHYNYGVSGDENNDSTKIDDTKRKKKAARTLSLGQLTLGKSAVQT
ncbi:hypothetical protein Sste5346_004640 [Sporothrix stenoceras]|uniref:Uncharacterized protein n=1 Tax=Sporothrix stenoceras TaxID=5173 RepID=A0ABR3Z947_9PEZI